MRREAEFFGETEMALVYIARRLQEARQLEAELTQAGLDYYVEPDEYRGGFLFPAKRVGAFFYVSAQGEVAARETLRRAGYRPWDE